MGCVVYGSLFCIFRRPCTEMFKGMWTVVESQTISRFYIVQNSLHHFSMMRKYT